MTLGITLLILFSALIHSLWNIQLKKSSDPFKFLINIAAWGWFIFTPYSVYKLFNSSISAETMFFAFLSFLIHFLYFIFLGKAYANFELSLVYPIARGLSVFLLPIYGIFILSETITVFAALGCAFIFYGIILTGSISHNYFTSVTGIKRLLKSGVISALTIGVIISLYSLADKQASGGIDPILYVWFTDTSAVLMFIYYQKKEGNYLNYFSSNFKKLIMPGIFQFTSYAIVIYAYSTTFLSYAGTFREVGTVFGAIFAKIFLDENFTIKKTVGIVFIISGALLISIF
ncbi:MAG: membrane protein [Chloroflexota bacterium]|nr:MAG: membrane protein [Chloroflexota bacterium]